MRRVHVAAGPGYDVLIGPGLLAGLGKHLAPLLPRPPSRVTLFFDAGLPEDLAVGAVGGLAGALGCEGSAVRVITSERRKTLEAVEECALALSEARHERGDPVIALGGGILSDLIGFTAATYHRGVPWVACPTTLLGMVDAAIGGKTAVNLPTGNRHGGLLKNMVGAFHQPLLVAADVAMLGTLPAREFRAGLAECIKHGMLSGGFGDPGLADWTGANMGAALTRDAATLEELIGRNTAVKAAVVAGDEREDSDLRALLNLGHTFAHAIEALPAALPSGEPLIHGEAVALGLIAAAAAGASLGLAPLEIKSGARDLIARAGLPVTAALPGDDRLFPLMLQDKKVRGRRLRLILPRDGARCEVITDPPPGAVAAGWAAIRQG
ncbi:MAG: 3-dehydroquinate synthase [Phycisphaerales bacterium]|nr:3-dehydroquinate synthase [Phycisphaerales bacterium]